MSKLDIVSLFTEVLVDDVLGFIEFKITPGSIGVAFPRGIIILLLRLCIERNAFDFVEKYYRQRLGIYMGSPFSPLLVVLYIEFFETRFLRSSIQSPATEGEQSSKFPFLGVNITRFSSGFTFFIYRKPPHSAKYLYVIYLATLMKQRDLSTFQFLLEQIGYAMPYISSTDEHLCMKHSVSSGILKKM